MTASKSCKTPASSPENIIQQAEERARTLTSEQEIVKRSQQHVGRS